MPNYNQPHPYDCGVDLHARSLFINICDPAGTTRFEKNLPASHPSTKLSVATNLIESYDQQRY